MDSFTCSLHHVHLLAEDKFSLAKWYEEHLQFEIILDIEASGESEGPVFISADGGKTALSIFDRQKRHRGVVVNSLPAFSVDLVSFIKLFKKFESEAKKIYDHIEFISFYITDPEKTQIEITHHQNTKDLRTKLESLNIPYFAENPATSK